MNTLIILCLGCMLAVQVSELWVNIWMQGRNLRTYSHAEKTLLSQIAYLEKRAKNAEEAFKIIRDTKPITAFALTADGIKALPEGWENAIAEYQKSAGECMHGCKPDA